MKRRLTCLFYHTAFCIFFTISFHIVNSQSPVATGIPISDRIVLATGAVKITEYEVRKNYLRFQQEYKSRHGHLPGPEAVKEWGIAFTDRTYLLADAWDKGYFEKPAVNRAVESMARLIIGQQGGLLEQKLLASQAKERALQEYFTAVRQESETVINPEVLNALENKLTQYGPLQSFDKNKFIELLSLPAITYSCNLKKLSVTTAAFMDFYNNLPLKKELGSIEAVITYMHAYVQDEYNYRKAEELGITRNAQFRLDRDNYKKNVIANLYETDELKAAIEVTDQEIRDWYENRKQDFVQAAEVIVSMFVFETRNHAMAARLAIRSRTGKSDLTTIDVIDTAHFKGILHTDLHHLLQYNELSLSDTVRKVIFSMPVGQMSRPVPSNGHYLVIVKESESGQRVQLPAEVKDILRKEIMEEKCRKKKQEQVKALKEKYKLQGNLEEVLNLK